MMEPNQSPITIRTSSPVLSMKAPHASLSRNAGDTYFSHLQSAVSDSLDD